MSIEHLKPAHFFDEERLADLKDIAPEAFVDGKINWSTLKDALGGELEGDEEDAEHFGLNWPGKREARRLAGKPSTGTLVPAKGEGVDEETTKNIYIEGENLEVLKLLRKSYSGRVKMIYIDPPYNTGNDFVYDDDFTEPLQDYLRRTGQIDGEGKPTTTNKKADGRFHSKWLSMMYPRLRLARELLRDDGVIFVSIDDNEVHHLRMLMNEVFGEENFVSELVWEKKKKGAYLSGTITNIKEYILVYSKNLEEFTGLIGEINENEETYPVIKTTNSRGVRKIGAGIRSKFKEKNYTLPKGSRISSGNMEMILLSELTIENGILKNDVEVDSNWIYSQELIDSYIKDASLYITQDLYFRRQVSDPRKKMMKDILSMKGEVDNNIKFLINNDLFIDGWGTNEDAFDELHAIFGLQNIMSFPKPSKLISKLALAALRFDPSAIACDFFSGSATTAHAILELNKQDGGKRQFVLVQMPEATPSDSEAAKAGYKTIAEIGKERIRRVIKKIKEEKAGELEGAKDLDLGFKVFKLARSHFKPWENYHGESVKKIEELFAEFVTPLVPEWRKIENGLLTEILLLEGFTLDSVIAPVPAYTENRIVEVSTDFHEHRLLVCLDDQIEEATVKALTLRENDSFICLDSAIDTQTKSRLADKGQIKTI